MTTHSTTSVGTQTADQISDDALTVLAPLPPSGRSVSVSEIIRMAVDSLVANKVRSFLTMLGVIIGVAAVVALLSLGSGASTLITSQVTSLGTNVLSVSAGQEDGGPGDSVAAQTLTYADAQAIAALNLPVVGPSPQYGSSASIVAPAADVRANITGVTPVYQEVGTLTLSAGSFINEEQVRGASQVIVLGATVAKDLFGKGQVVGQTVRVEGQMLRVIGVLTAKGGGIIGSSVDGQAFVPITVAQQRLFGGRSPDGNNYLVSSISLSVIDSANIKAVQSRIERLLRQRHHLAADGSKDDFNVSDQSSFLSTLTTITTAFTLFLGAVAGISLLVGGIGIMNIMLVSVTERTREIGLRKAVGARGRDILLQFVVEALVLSVAGGLIGLAFGAVAPIAATVLGYLKAPVTLSSALIAVGFSLAVGLFFGIYPARRASKLDPIQALRYE